MAFAGLDDGARAWEMFRLINPIHHGSSADAIAKYRVEPYVVAADVYGVAPHVGRGGWTWYTGSAGWMYRLILESLLGFHLESECLTLRPQFPADWSEFTIHYHYQQTQYHLRVVRCGEGTQVSRVSIDGVDQSQLCVKLVNDGGDHRVLVEIGQRPAH